MSKKPEGTVSPEKLAAEKLAWEYDTQLAEIEREHGKFPADTTPRAQEARDAALDSVCGAGTAAKLHFKAASFGLKKFNKEAK